MDRHSADIANPQGALASTGGTARPTAPRRSFASRLGGYEIFLSFALGPAPGNANPYERNNLWQLYTALSMGPEKVRFICVWDGKGGGWPGGTKHMHDSVKKRSGLVYVLDTNILFK